MHMYISFYKWEQTKGKDEIISVCHDAVTVYDIHLILFTSALERKGNNLCESRQ